MRFKLSQSTLLIFLLAIIIRIPLLFVSGYPPDLYYFESWSSAMGEHGVRSFYALFGGHELSFPSYALYAPVLWGIDFLFGGAASTISLKIPIIFFDIGSGILLYSFLKKQGARFALIISAAYLFNPALLYAGVIWGQVDTIIAFFVFLALWLLVEHRFSLAWLALTIAFFIKPQAVIFTPLFFFISFREKGWRAVFALIPSFLLAAAVVVYYFGLDIVSAWESTLRTVTRYPYLSANALNIWFPPTLFYGEPVRDTMTFFSIITPRFIGLAFFVFAYAMTLRLLWRKNYDTVILFFSEAFIAFAFFMLTTQMHERYLFPFFLLAAPLLARSLQWRITWGVLSVSFLLNLFIVFVPKALASGSTLFFFATLGLWIHIIVFAWSVSFLLSLLNEPRTTCH